MPRSRETPPLNTRSRSSRTSVADKPTRSGVNTRVARSSVAERARKAQPSVRVSRAPEPLIEHWPIVTGPSDPILTAVVWALVCFGVVMVYSASAIVAYHSQHQDGQFFLYRQAIFAAAGLPLMHLVSRVDYHQLKSTTYVMLLGVLALLCIVAFGFGHSVGGAARWISFGLFRVQPVEIAKVVWVCVLAYSLSRKTASIRSFTVGFLPHLAGAMVLGALCLLQPDFGSAVMIVLITFMMLFAAGARLSYLLGAVLLAAAAVIYLVAGTEYRMRRWQAFISPYEHRADAGYQLWESMMGFGAGGLRGLGLGHSRQKLFFLPEAHTDFISAIVGEELGLLGFVGLAAVFGLLVWRGLRAAVRSVDEHGTYLAGGLTFLIGLQALTNLAVAVGLLPTKGLVLPFISYGGSSLLMNCVAMGVVLNVSKSRVLRTDAALGGARISISPASTAGSTRNKVPKVAGGLS
jgi:cell division protein FtsW